MEVPHHRALCTLSRSAMMILIGAQIVNEIEKLINIVCEHITIVHINKCIGTH
jgi:hypothetical protein